MRISTAGLTLGILSLGAGISVQATPIVLTPIANYQKDMHWQEIKQTSYDFVDANANNLVDVGEAVTFTVEMDKLWWGRHDFDALKVWLTPEGSPSDVLLTDTEEWNFSNSNTWRDDSRRWRGGTRSFSFTHIFTSAGLFDFTASVMCSADLSGLYNDGPNTFDRPTQNDWNAWTPNAHKVNVWRQGETEIYQLKVVEAPEAVPEPGTLALFGLGLVGLAGLRRFRKSK